MRRYKELALAAAIIFLCLVFWLAGFRMGVLASKYTPFETCYQICPGLCAGNHTIRLEILP